MTQPLADDMLRGAAEIAAFLGFKERQVYHLSDGRLPVFRIGAILCARKSTLTEWIAEQERQAVAANDNTPAREVA